MSKIVTNEVSSYILDELDAQGLPVDREADLVRPTLPPDITALGDEDLMLLYTQFSSYSDFVNTQLSCAIIDERDIERQIEYEEASALIRHHTSNSKGTVTIMKAMVDVDPEIAKLKKLHTEKYAYRKLLETLANNCERGSMVCSRELTRRTAGDTFKTRTRKFTI